MSRSSSGARRPRRRVRCSAAAVLLTALVPLGLGPGSPAPAVAAGPGRDLPPLHALQQSAPIAVPDGVRVLSNQASSLHLVDGDRWAILNVSYDGEEQVGAVRLDRPGFSCISCGVLDGAREARPFPDERRVFTAAPSGGSLGDLQFAVVECTPSIVDCRERVASPVTFPRDGLADGAQNREPRISPDGRHVTWTEVRADGGPVMVLGRLVRGEEEYRVADPVVLNPPYRLGGSSAEWVPGTRYYETGGGWADGGRTLVYRSTTSAMNYDIWELDLATGRRTQVTRDLDYNEIYEASPDGRMAVASSARGLDRMDVFTQLVRPAFLDTMAFPQLGRIALHNNRRCMNEPWLMDRAGQRGGYSGQPLVTQDRWAMRGVAWFADGRRLLVSEQPLTATAGSGDDDGAQLRVIEIAGLEAGPPAPAVDLDRLPIERWAIPYDDYRASAERVVRHRVVRGRASGTATLDYTGNFASGTWSVRYRHFSDDGRTTLDGRERISTASAAIASEWEADLRSRGERTGTMKGHLEIGYPSSFTGSVRTVVDGRTWSGVPTQEACPGVERPRLRVSRIERTGLRLRAQVTARVPESPVAWPVQGARVTGLGGLAARTDEDGWVTLRLDRPRIPRLVARGDGFRPSLRGADGSGNRPTASPTPRSTREPDGPEGSSQDDGGGADTITPVALAASAGGALIAAAAVGWLWRRRA